MVQERRLELVDLDQVEVDPDNIRTWYDEEHIANLRDALVDLVKAGEEYINPPVVFPLGNNRYRVKHGNCRVLAAKQVVKQLHVFIDQRPSSETSKVLDQLSENLLQGGLSAMDTARALKRLKDAESLSLGGTVDVLKERGLSKGKWWVQMHLGLLELDPRVQNAVDQGHLAARTAWVLRGLPGHEQVEWMDQVIQGGLSHETLTKTLGRRDIDPVPGPGTVQDSSNPEWVQADLRARLADRADAATTHTRQAGEDDGGRRSGAVARRWTLLPLASAALRDSATLDPRISSQLSDEAERQLAQEAASLGGRFPEESVALVQRVHEELDGSEPFLMATLNGLAQLLARPSAAPPESALRQFLIMRLRGLLADLTFG